MVEFQPSKLVAWVRFPSLAPIFCALSSVDRVPGYEPVGRRFESSRARQTKNTPNRGVFLFGTPCAEPCAQHALKVRIPLAESATKGSIPSRAHPQIGVFFVWHTLNRTLRTTCAEGSHSACGICDQKE